MQKRTEEGKKKKPVKHQPLTGHELLSPSVQKLLLVQPGSVGPEWEGASSVEAQDTALSVPSHGEGGGQGRVARQRFGKIFQKDRRRTLCPSLSTPRNPALCCLLATSKRLQMPQCS